MQDPRRLADVLAHRARSEVRDLRLLFGELLASCGGRDGRRFSNDVGDRPGPHRRLDLSRRRPLGRPRTRPGFCRRTADALAGLRYSRRRHSGHDRPRNRTLRSRRRDARPRASPKPSGSARADRADPHRRRRPRRRDPLRGRLPLLDRTALHDGAALQAQVRREFRPFHRARPRQHRARRSSTCSKGSSG